MKVAVAGGTGVAGSMIVAALERAGDQPVVLARSRGVDLISGRGLEDALPGCDAVIDASNVPTSRRRAAEEFFGAAATRVVGAAKRFGVGHVVVLSIVGIDRVDLGYYAGKRRQEEVVTRAEVPWTVLRTTQFHDFAAQFLARSGGPVALIPRMRARPVATEDVAAALVDIVRCGPQGYAGELAGPEEMRVAEMARQVLRRNGSRRRVLEVRIPGRAGRAAASGGLLPAGEFVAGARSFGDYLTALG